MNHDAYRTLRVSRQDGIARVTIDNPPINVLSVAVMTELRHLLTTLAGDDTVRVIVFHSADPDFFLAHVDMTATPEALAGLMAGLPDGVNVFQAVGEQLRRQPQVTIVKLAGKARGGGAEFVAAADLAFAAIGRAGLGQIEALMGIVPGGGATQYLTERIGRNRALEVVLGAELFDAETAERYGWINRAVPAGELDEFVDRLAGNIAALPDGVVAAVKHAIVPREHTEGLARENEAWAGLVLRPGTAQLMGAGLAHGAQTRDGEQDLEGLFRSLLRCHSA
ncbi:putative enoyl-CoA hydratase/isomerase [Actinoplanes missouriensis 431]|uniref:Putative enoyl-CoA hydratase/isomerase n=1 Tax=Actinoplanes missouriensis (strain ATCC 14538 / DSM 43046 / CBS 188.64 / JCM 3121 / NBRC 102363 / NCIMB 12654 / NRRL B-3342 / UNCC 431) TaxID=512565 RepID=I0H4T5_ACTM4|nr:enoyl-CoA hydratase/isomerase family protein [Actinoplanes missouriensis]BAL88022.1 putative enoyl-CoA hydratase/isomerase [Actinoplanes missouriensis 431]